LLEAFAIADAFGALTAARLRKWEKGRRIVWKTISIVA